jgi:hypothetical protein
VAYRLCDYIAKGQKEMLVSNRLRSIADVVLERVAEILGEWSSTSYLVIRILRSFKAKHKMIKCGTAVVFEN